MMPAQSYSEAVERFGAIAQKYCALIESRSTLDRTEFLLQIYQLLPALIGEGIRLPQVELPEEDTEKQEGSLIHDGRAESDMTHEQWNEIYSSLTEKLGDWVSYSMVFDPRKDTEVISGSLADDFADIYRDLKNGLRLSARKDVSPEDIVFQWRLAFQINWGRHAMSSLRVIHCLVVEHDDDW